MQIFGRSCDQARTEQKDPFIFEAKRREDQKESRRARIRRIAYLIFSVVVFPVGLCRLAWWGCHYLIGRIVVIGQFKGNREQEKDRQIGREALLKMPGATHARIQTADGVLLDGVHILGVEKCNYLEKNAPTVIFFGGNGEKFGYKAWNFNQVQFFCKRGWNVLLFNYRGVGNSKGFATSKGLEHDSEAVFQYVHRKLGVSKENILLFGHSLGGAVATELASHHPAQLVNTRSFSSIPKLLKVPRGVNKKGSVGLAHFVKAFGWELSAEKSWPKVKGPKVVAFDRRDQIIPYEGSLHNAIKEEKKQPRVSISDFIDSNGDIDEEAWMKALGKEKPELQAVELHSCAEEEDPHNRPLTEKELRSIDRGRTLSWLDGVVFEEEHFEESSSKKET